jgi:protein-tyrosine sulfotransferase
VTYFTAADMATYQGDGDEPRQAPVFVLTSSRSGSTLLRFLLDGHPDLACPPETSIASACAALAHSWDVVEHSSSGERRRISDPITLSPHAAAAIRAAIDRLRDHYLSRHGKRRWCDKSLDSYQFADIVAQVYPDARFICLFRHCMDVVASGVESCPWGVSRYGFDPFAAQYPGNSVAAIGSYWLTYAAATLAFKERNAERCHVVRYEDLVTAPEEEAEGIFSFLGVAQVPGIAQTCFRTPHEGDGPGDEKIWFTNEITSGSMGRGVAVPAAALPPPLREAINETLAKLGYRQIDDDWNKALGPADPRVRPGAPPKADGQHGAVRATANGHDAPGRADVAAAARAVATRLGQGGDAVMREVGARWPALSAAVATIVVQSADGYREEVRVDFGAASGGEPVALLTAAPGTWRALLDGKTNVITEITAGRLRCVNSRDTHRIRSDELHAVAVLLGLARIPLARTPDASHGTIQRAQPNLAGAGA